MKIQFRILFTVNIAHAYYDAGCRDFDFIIPSDTVSALKNARLLVRVREGKLYVLYEADENGNALVPAAGTTLRFGLKLLNPYFGNITDLAFISGASTPLYRNALNLSALDRTDGITLTGRVFSHPLGGSARPVTVALKNPDGQALDIDTITAVNNREAVCFDLNGQPAGIYTVEEVYPSETKTRAYYSDAELQQNGVFGIIAVLTSSVFYTSAPSFAIAFSAREEILKYYIVARNYSHAEFNQLSVSDTGFTEESRPQVIFTKIASSAFTGDDIAPSLLGESDVRVVLFRSQSSIARQEKGRKKIQLNKHSDVLIRHLPQPGADKARGDIIINISKL